MAKALTTKSIEAMKADPVKRIEVPDPALTGLYLIVQPSGAKSWALRYRFAGKPTKLTLGKWPVMGLADARAAATTALQSIELGGNPSESKKASKAAALDAQLTGRDKVRTLIDQFDQRHLSKLRTGKSVRQAFDNHVLPEWGERSIQTIKRRDVVDLLDGIVDAGHGAMASRIRAHLSKFFNWLVERDVIEAAPTSGVKPPAKPVKRDRVLSDDEVRWLWIACGRVGKPWGDLGRMLLLTGQRLREVAHMTDGEIKGALWHLSSDRVKNDRAHTVPLSDAAQAVLSGLERVKNPSGYLFTTNARTPVSGFHKAHSNIAKQMELIAAEERGEPVEIQHWAFHDLRRTAATGMARLGIAVRVTEAVLNHVSGTGGGIVAVYQRHDFADEKRQALEAWGRFVMQLIDGAADNVVRLGNAG